MAAGTSTPIPAGQGPSVLGIAMSIGAKIRDAAEDAKEQREKAAEKGETPKKGSLFKSALANKFNPIKSKKAKSNWAKQFDWNKTTKSDQQVKPPTGDGGGGEGKAKLKEFIAGGFTAILKDTGMMVSKLDGVKMMAGENLSEVTRASSTLTVIKDSIDAQTELRRRALDEAKFARAEKKLEKTKDVAGVSDAKKPEDKGGGKGGEDGGGGGPWDWILGALGIADLLDNFLPGIKKLNPFKKSPVTQGKGGKPSGPRMPGTGPKVTTSGGAPAAKQPWWKKMLPFADDAAKGGVKAGAKGAGGLLGRLLPGAQTALGIGLAAKSFAEGDAIGGALNLGSALPGPLGWAFLAASLGRDTFAPGLGNKELGQAFSTPGLTPEQTSGMSGLERGMLDISTPSLFSEGGIVPSSVPPSPVSPMAEGGIKPGMYDNPTKGILSPGQSVIPLNRSEGKAMFGKSAATSPGETAMDTVGAMILGVSAGMLGKTDSGSVGDQVRQNIRKASKEFGISNLTFTSALGRAQFKKVDVNKDAKDFMKSLFGNIKIGGGGSGGGKGGNGNKDKPPGADLENTGVKNEIDLSSGKGAVQFTDGFDPTGTKLGRGRPHMGQDIGTGGEKGWYVAMKKTGKVTYSGFEPGGGNSVYINTGGGVEYRFMHLKDPSPLKEGQDYNGETIGEIGNTGRSSGEHLHFEKLVNGKHVDPKNDADALLDIGKETIKNFRPRAARPPVVTTPNKADPGTQQASLPTGDVTPLSIPAQDGGSFNLFNPFTWGQMLKAGDAARQGKGPTYQSTPLGNALNRNAELARLMQESRGHAAGGPMDSRRAHAAKLKAQRASQQRSRLGVQRVNGRWVNMGVSDQAVGRNPWWQVWNKKGATAERKAKQEKLAAQLAERLNRQEAAKLKPKPRPSPAAPGRAPASAGGTRPSAAAAPSSPSTAAVVAPPVTSSVPSATASGSFGSAVPAGKFKAMAFADFLYPDLV